MLLHHLLNRQSLKILTRRKLTIRRLERSARSASSGPSPYPKFHQVRRSVQLQKTRASSRPVPKRTFQRRVTERVPSRRLSERSNSAHIRSFTKGVGDQCNCKKREPQTDRSRSEPSNDRRQRECRPGARANGRIFTRAVAGVSFCLACASGCQRSRLVSDKN